MVGYEKRFLSSILSVFIIQTQKRAKCFLRVGAAQERYMMPESALLQFYTQKLIPINEK
jgi:hypothetical protein